MIIIITLMDQQNRRVLPKRASRGQRAEVSEQQQAQDDLLYQQLFKHLENPDRQPSRSPLSQQNGGNSEANQIHTYKGPFINPQFLDSKLRENRIRFPYARGYHYFYDLTIFPRDQASVSYADDQANIFNSTYSHDNDKIGNSTVGQIINRRYFGLPFEHHDEHFSKQSRDKNICHSYLFGNEDRKYQIDRALAETRGILRYLETLTKDNKLGTFGILSRDLDLEEVKDPSVDLQKKEQILRRKIKILEERKNLAKASWNAEDQRFFHHSLNQTFHNAVEQQESQVSWRGIMNELIHKKYQLREQLQVDHEGKTLAEIPCLSVAPLFKYSHADQLSISPQKIQQIQNVFNDDFFAKTDELFNVLVPDVILAFNNEKLFQLTTSLFSSHLINRSQAGYYIIKSLWKKAFGFELPYHKRAKIYARDQFQTKLAPFLNNLRHWQDNPEGKPKQYKQIQQYPMLDEYLDINKTIQTIYPRNGQVQISVREYAILSMFHHLYLCLEEFGSFVLENEGLLDMMVSDFYPKAHHAFVQIVGSERLAMLDNIIEKLLNYVFQSDIQVVFSIKWLWIQQTRCGIVTRECLEGEWLTQKSESAEQQQDSEDVLEKHQG